ncbi:glycosyltransferase [Buttiauxella agrestis]|nr:glycosyltransferase [Buttiauxella agrestis]
MKVLQVCKFFPPVFGGIEQVAYDISDGFYSLHSRSIDVLCVDNKSNDSEEKHNYKIFRCGILGVVFSTPISFSFIKKWREIRNNYDVIHLHLPNPLAVIALFLFPTKNRIVIHWHSDIVKQKKLLFLFKPFQTWILKQAARVIVTSPVYGIKSSALQPYQQKLTCIPIGIDENKMPNNVFYESELHKKYAGKKIVFSLGRLVYYKGFEFLVKAAKQLPPDTVILIGGEGELYGKLTTLISELELTDKVILLGGIPYDQLSAYYKLCDVFCLPSIHESEAFGVVQLEAMSFKKPVVSTDIANSGVPWVNKNGYSGVVVEPGNSEALAAGIITVLEKANVLSENAYLRFHTNFTKNKMVESLNQLYSELR